MHYTIAQHIKAHVQVSMMRQYQILYNKLTEGRVELKPLASADRRYDCQLIPVLEQNFTAGVDVFLVEC